MRLSRAQVVTVCQQTLVTGVVLAVAASAAGVRSLDIVPSPGAAGAGAEAGQAPGAREAMTGVVASEPVAPKVREVDAEPVEPDEPAAREAPQAAAGGAPTDATVTAVSEPTPVEGYGTVGATWSAEGQQYAGGEIVVEVRTEVDGVWADWAPVEYRDDHGPDADEAEGRAERPGTDAIVVGEVDQVQMRASTVDGSVPEDLRLAVIDPGVGATQTEAPEIEPGSAPAAAPAESAGSAGSPGSAGPAEDLALSSTDLELSSAARPTIFSRSQWGANEKLRSGSPSYGTVRAGFVHHTVNANGYAQADVPALIRGIYAYHTQSRGWSDIGYNFLVDRFGQIWEGRHGGVDRAVVGAHTSGYNSSSFALSAIGNFETATPPQAVVNAYSALFAWKLSLSGVSATATGIKIGSRTFRAVNGHRDAGATACPGRYLYAKLPEIRTAARNRQLAGAPAPAPPAPAPPAPAPPAPAPPAPAPPASAPRTAFTPHVTTAGNWNRFDRIVAVGDVTGDGRGDVLARVKKTQVTQVFRGDGSGRVARAGVGATRSFARALTITSAGDWDGDKRNDLLVVDASRTLSIWSGRGNGTFVKHRTLSNDWSRYTHTIVAGDLTGDGRPDVVTIGAGQLRLHPAVEGGGLGPSTLVRNVGTSFVRLAGFHSSAGDLSGDGIVDLMLQRRSDRTASVLKGTGTATLGTTVEPFLASRNLRRISVAQMTGSHHGDLVGVHGRTGELHVVRHNGGRS